MWLQSLDQSSLLGESLMDIENQEIMNILNISSIFHTGVQFSTYENWNGCRVNVASSSHPKIQQTRNVLCIFSMYMYWPSDDVLTMKLPLRVGQKKDTALVTQFAVNERDFIHVIPSTFENPVRPRTGCSRLLQICTILSEVRLQISHCNVCANAGSCFTNHSICHGGVSFHSGV